MDIAPTATTTTVIGNNVTTNTNTTTPAAKSPEPDTETPTRIQPNKTLSFTNGVLKRRHSHHHHHHHHHHLAPTPVVVMYKECLKNHVASSGGHALDGCGEFMPSPTATPTDPTSLKCAACGCHRNFHRREPEDSPPVINNTTTTTIEYQPHHRHHPPPPPPQAQQPIRSPNSASPPPISSSYYPSAPHMLLALSGGVSGLNDSVGINSLPGSSPRKRFRTKFSQNQKERMYQFAERVGWKMQKRDEDLIQEFCNEVGVDKGVLKVWMHNNKNTFGRRDANGNIRSNDNLESAHTTTTTTTEHNNNNNNNNNNINNGGNSSDNENRYNADNNIQNLNHHHLFENDSVAHAGTNRSSSSS